MLPEVVSRVVQNSAPGTVGNTTRGLLKLADLPPADWIAQMKANVVVPVAAITLVLGLGGGYWYWTKTPQYSLVKLAEAVKNHDDAEFHQYFETRTVASNAITDLTTAELSQVGGPMLLRRFLGIAIIGALTPDMTGALTGSIDNYIARKPGQGGSDASAAGDTSGNQTTPGATGDPNARGSNAATGAAGDPNPGASDAAPAAADDASGSARHRGGFLRRAIKGILHEVVEAIKPPPLRDVLHQMGFSKENYRGHTDFQVEGKLCHVGLIFQAPDKTAPITVMLELENVDEHWRVVRISNMDELARNLNASSPS